MRLKSFFDFIRYKNLLIIVVSQLLTRNFLVLPSNFQDFRFALLVFATVIIAAAGYVINDYFDVKIDLINKPDEVYIGRFMQRRKALVFHQVLSGFGVFLGVFLGWKIFVLNIFAVTILWFYASVFKKKPFIGNLIVAFLTSLAILEVGIFYFPKNYKYVVVYAVFAFFVNLIREIIKDIEDIKGDKMHGAKTMPIVIGIRKTKYVIYFILSGLVVSVLVYLIKINQAILWQIFSILAILVIYILYKIIVADRKVQFKVISNLCKYLMILGLASMIFCENS